MSRQAKIIIFSIVLVFSYFLKQENEETNVTPENNSPITNNTKPKTKPIEKYTPPKVDFEPIEPITSYSTPQNGFSPYDFYLGKGVYNNNSGNIFVIKNSNKSDAVVLLVNTYGGKKVRNEFIRKGTDFSMTGVPNGTYYLQWFSGNDWSPNLKIGGFVGGFQTNQSFTKTRDMSDWMKVSGYDKWTVTLYTVEGGDVASEDINPEDFLN